MLNKTPRPVKLIPAPIRAASGAVWATLALLAAPCVLQADTLTDSSSQAVTLVELYTSQGCSSCPPADAFLQDLSDREDVLALSFHVDYWNNDGWADPFSQPSFSFRQQAYREEMGLDYVYTPQMVVAGTFAAPGGQREAILKAISDNEGLWTASRPSLILNRVVNDRIRVALSNSSSISGAALYAAVYQSDQITRVRGGENRGRTLRNVNIVKRLVRLTPNITGDLELLVPLADLDASSADGIAVFVQRDRIGPVVAAVALPPRPGTGMQVSLNSVDQD